MTAKPGWIKKSLEERFFSKVEQPANSNACWRWLGGNNGKYGSLGWIDGGKRVFKKAHRISWELHHKIPLPDGMLGCHTCDNPWCVNPLHVFPGTMKDNLRDASRKGRTEHGERHHSAKLSNDAVYKIRELFDSE